MSGSTRTDSAPGFNRSETFGYDGLDRLTSHALTGGSTVTVAYDAAGNITAKSDVGGYTYDRQKGQAKGVRT